jgi:1-acyl-sn-glycerol-3-phosphate acyltransferase
MIINSFKDLYDLSGEISYFKRELPKIKVLFEDFDSSENPKESLEKIISAAKLNPLTDDFLKISKTYDMILRAEENAEKEGWSYACLEAVKEMGVNVKVKSKENIPCDHSALYVTNHPYGLLDSAALLGNLGSILNKNGKQIKFVAMNQLKFIKGIEEILHFVHCTTPSSNLRSLRESIDYLRGGGNLAVCPSGTMSGPGLREYPWKNEITPFISNSSYVVPIWTSGPNHEGLYNLFARFKKTEKLRRVLSFREAWNKSGKTVCINIGEPIPSEWLMDKIKDKKERIEYLRRCAENLKVEI